MKRYSAERYIKLIVIVVVAVIFTLCTVFYTQRKDGSGSQFDSIPSFTYEPWFVFPVLTLSLLGYLYVVMTNKVLALTFAINSAVLLVSVVLTFGFLYFSPRTGTTVQTFAFNIVVNTGILMMYVLYNSSHYISGCLALLPMFLMGGYYLYLGHLLA